MLQLAEPVASNAAMQDFPSARTSTSSVGKTVELEFRQTALTLTVNSTTSPGLLEAGLVVSNVVGFFGDASKRTVPSVPSMIRASAALPLLKYESMKKWR